MMMNFVYGYTKASKEADTHKLGRPPGRVDEGTSKEYELQCACVEGKVR